MGKEEGREFVGDEGVSSKTAPVEFVKYSQPSDGRSERQLKDEITKKCLKRVERPAEDIGELKNYFSKEVSSILDKIKGHKQIGRTSRRVSRRRWHLRKNPL